MKVLFVIRSLQRAGAERQLVTLATGLHARGHDCAVAVFYEGGPLELELLAAGVRVLPLHKQGRWDTVGFERRMTQMIRRETPDVLHTYLTGANLMAVQLKPFLGGVPVVWGVLASYIDMRVYDRVQRLAYRVEPLAAHAADLIICNSYAGREDAIRMGYPEQRTITVENGINTERFAPSVSDRITTRELLSVPPESPLVAIVGRLDPVKDHATFLRAAAHVRAQLPACRFVIMGDGLDERRSALVALAESLGISDALLWAPARGELEKVYSAFDVLVSASTSEGSSNVIAEAMACGVPCAVTDVGDSARIVGNTGAFAPPSNPEALAKAILGVLARRSPALSVAARERIVQNYTIARMVVSTETALAGVVERSKRGKKERGTGNQVK